MRREVPLTIVFVCGAFMAFQYFVPHYVSATIYQYALNWTIIIGIFTLAVGIGSLVNLHYDRFSKRKQNWPYSIVTLAALLFMTVLGLFSPNAIQDPNGLFMKMYFYVLAPVQATMFALLAFFIASAAYRAFRARTLLATLLLLSAAIVMLGRIPIGDMLTGWLPEGLRFSDIAKYILDFPNTAAKRAIYIGVGLGIAATSLKIILGIERTWLGGGK
jgi:hypothetical protein